MSVMMMGRMTVQFINVQEIWIIPFYNRVNVNLNTNILVRGNERIIYTVLYVHTTDSKEKRAISSKNHKKTRK